MQKWFMLVCPLLLALAVGCLKVDQNLTINADGSATVEYTYGMSEETAAQMEAMAQMGKQYSIDEDDLDDDDDNDFTFDEDEIRKQFEGLKAEGVKLDSVSSTVKDGWKYMTVKYTAKSLEALANAEAYGGGGLNIEKDADGNYVLTQKGSDFGQDEDDETPPEMKEMMMKQMLPMMAGMRIAIRVKVPGKIIESNGAVDGNQASWIYDVDKDPSFITEKAEDMKLVFSGKGLNLPTIKAE